MIDLERDLRVVEAMVAELKPYLLSNTLYWSLSGGSIRYPFPKGTLGGLFIRLRQLEALRDTLAPDQQLRLKQAAAQADRQLKQWPVQAEEKAAREIKARLRTWGAYVEECADDPAHYKDEYPTQVQGRTILELLLDFAGRAVDGQGFIRQLTVLDQRLSENIAESPFVWDETLLSAFPPDRFWWLYASPQRADTASTKT